MTQNLSGLDVTITSFLGGLFAAGMIIAIGVFLLISLIVLFFHTFTLMFGAKVVDIKDRTFGKALMATFLSIFIGSIPCAILFFIFWPLGIVAFLVMPCFVVKWIYDCSLVQAFLASISALVASFVVVIVLIISTVFFIKGALNNKKSTEVEKVSKVEIKEIPESPIINLEEERPLIEKVSVTEPIAVKTLVKEPQMAKVPNKESVKIKTNPKPKKAIAANPKNKIQQVRSLANNKKKPEVIITSKPKAKSKLSTNKSTIKLAKQ